MAAKTIYNVTLRVEMLDADTLVVAASGCLYKTVYGVVRDETDNNRGPFFINQATITDAQNAAAELRGRYSNVLAEFETRNAAEDELAVIALRDAGRMAGLAARRAHLAAVAEDRAAAADALRAAGIAE